MTAAKTHLKISPAPFKPSFLSIPPSPFSPKLPITPPPKAQTFPTSLSRTTATTSFTSTSQPAPRVPVPWIWKCHLCYASYPLGATRRCLRDGHYLCSGTTAIKDWRAPVGGKRRRKKKKFHDACTSRFDYKGWERWGEWRRKVEKERFLGRLRSGHQSGLRFGLDGQVEGEMDEGIENSAMLWNYDECGTGSGLRDAKAGKKANKKQKNCASKCDFPSQCRWGRIDGVHEPAVTTQSGDSDVEMVGGEDTAGTSVSTTQAAVGNTSTSDNSSKNQQRHDQQQQYQPYQPDAQQQQSDAPATSFDEIFQKIEQEKNKQKTDLWASVTDIQPPKSLSQEWIRVESTAQADAEVTTPPPVLKKRGSRRSFRERSESVPTTGEEGSSQSASEKGFQWTLTRGLVKRGR